MYASYISVTLPQSPLYTSRSSSFFVCITLSFIRNSRVLVTLKVFEPSSGLTFSLMIIFKAFEPVLLLVFIGTMTWTSFTDDAFTASRYASTTASPVLSFGNSLNTKSGPKEKYLIPRPFLIRSAFVAIAPPNRWVNSKVVVGTIGESTSSLNKQPGPIGGSWSTSPISTTQTFDFELQSIVLNILLARKMSIIEDSSMTNR